MFKAIIEYAKPIRFSDVLEGEVPNYNAMINEIKAHLIHMPPPFRKQLLLWLKKEFN
jgi:hypothetical protein